MKLNENEAKILLEMISEPKDDAQRQMKKRLMGVAGTIETDTETQQEPSSEFELDEEENTDDLDTSVKGEIKIS